MARRGRGPHLGGVARINIVQDLVRKELAVRLRGAEALRVQGEELGLALVELVHVAVL